MKDAVEGRCHSICATVIHAIPTDKNAAPGLNSDRDRLPYEYMLYAQ